MTPEFHKDREALQCELAAKIEKFEKDHGVVVTGFESIRATPYSTSTAYVPLVIKLKIAVW